MSKENTISTGPPGGGGPASILAALEDEGSSSSDVFSSSLVGGGRLAPRFPFAGALEGEAPKVKFHNILNNYIYMHRRDNTVRLCTILHILKGPLVQ